MDNFNIQAPLFLDVLADDPKMMEKLNKFSRLLSKSDVLKYLKDKDEIPVNRRRGQPQYDKTMMLSAVILSFAFGAHSLREIEEKCCYDIRLLYTTGNQKPSHMSFCNFINDCIVENADEIFTAIVSAIGAEMKIELLEDVFIDGSKFEANSNKYKFVWKPTKKIEKLMGKFKTLMEAVGISTTEDVNQVVAMTSTISNLKENLKSKGINPEEIQTGKGKRISAEERTYLKAMEMLKKMITYVEDIRICGPDRNSYYKTDHEATAMNLKEDYYSGAGSNMHAAYNIQFAVSKGIIIAYYASQDRSDTNTLPCFVEKLYKCFGRYPINICADAAYGSYANYGYIHSKNIGNYLKYGSWAGEIDGTRPQLCHLSGDKMMCLDNREMVEIGSQNGYTNFKVDCRGCKLKKYCMKATKLKKNSTERTFHINLKWIKYREEAKTNLLSRKGIELRVNRSIQVEGAFGNVKQNHDYERFARRGLKKVNAEIMLICLAVNIRKLFSFWESGKVPEYWKAPDDLEPEQPHPMSRTIKNGGKKKPKSQPNQIARKSVKKKK